MDGLERKSLPEDRRAPRALIFDSGLGGLTVLAEIRRLRPDVEVVYVADDAAFPYGRLSESELIARVETAIARVAAEFTPDIAVIACNTASTLALPRLRAAHPHLPFIGTVPAIKPAAQASRSRLISILSTPATAARDYTKALVREHARGCEVRLVGSERLAPIAERAMRGGPIDEAEIAREIAPAFVQSDGRRTDHIVLACTHFPLLADRFTRLSPWPVVFVDPAAAIARRLDALVPARREPASSTREDAAIFSSGLAPSPELQKVLRQHALTFTPAAAIGLASA